MEPSKEGDSPKYKLFIYNLPIHIVPNEDKVKSIFTEYGVVTDCTKNRQSKNKQVYYVTFEDENVCKKLKSIGEIIFDDHKIQVCNTSKFSKISAEFVEEKIGKRAIMNIFSLFGALKHYKYGINKNEYGFFVSFKDEEVNKMLIAEGSFDYYGHKILIKEVFTYYNKVPIR